MSVTVDVDNLIRRVQAEFGLQLDRDLAERMRSTMEPALRDLETARAQVAHDGSEPADFEAALLELAPERVRRAAAAFAGSGAEGGR